MSTSLFKSFEAVEGRMRKFRKGLTEAGRVAHDLPRRRVCDWFCGDGVGFGEFLFLGVLC